MKEADDFFDKASKMADQAEGKVKEAFEKAKMSDAYAKISDAMKQAGDAVDKKIEEFKQSDLPGKAEKLRDQAEAKAETFIDQAKAYGSILANDMEQVIVDVKGKLSGDGKKKAEK
jgi:5-methylthioribose kinase